MTAEESKWTTFLKLEMIVKSNFMAGIIIVVPESQKTAVHRIGSQQFLNSNQRHCITYTDGKSVVLVKSVGVGCISRI